LPKQQPANAGGPQEAPDGVGPPTGASARPGAIGLGLIRSCHPIPSLAVTVISAGLAGLAGLDAGPALLMVLAVLTGQLSIGWSNDRLDAARDRAVNRVDKPLAAGAVAPGLVTAAIAVAVAATVVFSLLLGYRAGLVALGTVACGWAYNLGLKATVWSWLPVALAFGLLPAIATLALSPPQWPAAWALAAGALLGVAAHIANVLPDLRDDVETGVRGLAHRLGPRRCVVIGPVLLLGASAIIVTAAAPDLGGIRWLVLAGCAGATTGAVIAGLRHPSSRLFFLATVVVAIAVVALFGLSGGRLT
jgi:4-hydroxybenzoate polyprenyltransferase